MRYTKVSVNAKSQVNATDDVNTHANVRLRVQANAIVRPHTQTKDRSTRHSDSNARNMDNTIIFGTFFGVKK